MSSIIQTEQYIDVADLGENVANAYHEFANNCGLVNGERWSWEVGEHGDDSVCESYIGQEKTDIISAALREKAGLKDGDIVNIVLQW